MNLRAQSKWLMLLLCTVWFVGLGGCQDQQVQQQLDSLKTSNADLLKRVQTLESGMKITTQEMTQTKQLLQKFTDALQAQNSALENLNNAVKDIQTRLVQLTNRSGGPGSRAKKK